VVYTDLRGKKQRYKLGAFPALKHKEALARAHKVINGAAEGKSPAMTKRQIRHSLTFAQLVDAFIAAKRGKLRSVERLKYRLELHCKHFFERPAISITKQDVRAVLAKLSDKHSMHNLIMSHVSTVYAHAMRNDLIPDNTINPARMIESADTHPRERVLSDDELRRIWRAPVTNGYDLTYRDILRVILLTASRRSEVSDMTWAEVDLDKAIWDIPGKRTKNKLNHHVPLSRGVLGILRNYAMNGRQREHEALIFSEADDRPIKEFWFASRLKRLQKLSGTSDWTHHDLRRTAATRMAEAEVPEHILSRVLNHVKGSRAAQADPVLKVYDRHSYAAEKRKALEAWATKLDEIVGGLFTVTTGNVQPIRKQVA